jgi:hypothetical protein
LNGLYNFVSSYIKPKQQPSKQEAAKQEAAKQETDKRVASKQEAAQDEAVVVERVEAEDGDLDEEEDEADVEVVSRPTLIGPQPLNGNTIPRDQLIIEAVDEEHSDSDPFFQVTMLCNLKNCFCCFSMNSNS